MLLKPGVSVRLEHSYSWSRCPSIWQAVALWKTFRTLSLQLHRKFKSSRIDCKMARMRFRGEAPSTKDAWRVPESSKKVGRRNLLMLLFTSLST